ncbi:MULTISPECIES: CoA ester lyase [unclassified Lentimicrobium]|uniref:HpcH/HpaI aldolase/citrate lyase family protein n=1 Tax=unclassified Lentimicrobium TaxID=2677434 RepID=UPI001555A6A7|nr:MULTISPECIES: aldolase/citrate lyase family protein [unclassified Lentimicrobium]NPD45607.1 HpcH/HpaI aldolase/citrate lyase family protein [Lentimicrobium sp. S6]NPD85032.1 HpcH/HpaI aldolase/citrate lyase family protein [Lentimicrobium sp. L6]
MKRKRRTMLYIPGNNPAMLLHGSVYGADSLLLDLEDAVALNQKDAARNLIQQMLKNVDYGNTEVCVRVNHLDTPFGMEDLKAIVPLQPDAIRYPKTETVEELQRLITLVEQIEDEHGLPHDQMTIHIMIETALGVQNVFDIAKYSKRVDAITIGGQDLTADMNIKSSKNSSGIDLARKMIVMAAKANRIDAIDTVWADIDDEEGLKQETEFIRQIGFSGKAVINPRQIDPIHEIYTPSDEEIRKAYRVVKEFNKNDAKGIGVFAIDGKMVDAPVVTRARYVLELAGVDHANI